MTVTPHRTKYSAYQHKQSFPFEKIYKSVKGYPKSQVSEEFTLNKFSLLEKMKCFDSG